MVEHREDHQAGHSREGDSDDCLLHGSRLGAGAGPDAPFEERGVHEREIDADDVRRDREDDDEGPALPIGQRASRQEDDDAEDDQADDGHRRGANGKLHRASPETELRCFPHR